MGKVFIVLYAAAFLDLCGVSMITMQLSNHLRQLGASHSTVGYIGSIYGFVQLFSSPVVGSYADRHGKRAVLLFCIILCGFGYLLLGSVSSLWMIAGLRVYLGVFKHPLNLIQSALSDLTLTQSSDKQTQALGYYQSACSLAFIVSPPIGGYLMQAPNGYSTIGVCVALIYTINSVMIYTCLPVEDPRAESANNSPQGTDNSSKKDKRTSSWSFLALANVDQISLMLILVSRFLLGFSGMVWRSTYSLLYKEVHNLSPYQIGWLISFNAFVQASIGCLMKYISMVIPRSLHQIFASCLLYAIAMVIVANVSNLQSLYMVILPMSTAAMVMKISSQTYVNQTIGRKHTAYLVGITSSMISMARLVSPVVVGHLMEHYDAATTLYVAAASTLMAACIYPVVEWRYHAGKTKMQ